MKSIVVGLGLCALGSSLTAQTENPPTARDIVKDDADWKMLEQGEVVLLVDVNEKVSKQDRGNPAFYPTGAILINSPVENVWNLINDKEAAPDYVQSLVRCRIVGKGAAHMMVEQEMKMNGLPGTFTYIVKHVMRPFERVDFERVSGDLRDIRGSWQFVPVEENTKTLLIYSLHVDPGRFVPQGLVRKGMAKNLPKCLLGIKTQVEMAPES
tara:strand:- start:9163 stop:9795 length:633 start_codon:yes stop_codon:yes gene_type:complete